MGNETQRLAKETPFEQEEVDELRTKYDMLRRSYGGTSDQSVVLDQKTFLTHFKGRQELGEIIFSAFDRQKNGRIDFREFVVCLSILMRGTEEAKRDFLFDLYDTDGSGYISRRDFQKMVRAFMGAFREIFGTLAEQRKGKGEDVQDLRSSLGSIPAEGDEFDDIRSAIDDYFSLVDTDPDGKLDRAEFLTFCHENPHATLPLDIVLRAVKQAALFDWETPASPSSRNRNAPDQCAIM